MGVGRWGRHSTWTIEERREREREREDRKRERERGKRERLS